MQSLMTSYDPEDQPKLLTKVLWQSLVPETPNEENFWCSRKLYVGYKSHFQVTSFRVELEF